MAGTFNKRERENKKQQERKQKEERRQERKENMKKGKTLDEMMAYIDENGNISATPPDPRKKITVNAEDIEIGVPKQRPVNPEDLLVRGIVTNFNHDKGYGFIKNSQTQESIFVHINSCAEPIKEGNRVIFEVEKGPKGLNAVRVRVDK